MATTVYKCGQFELIDGTIIYTTPLKIKYLREFMDRFEEVKLANNNDEAIDYLSMCAVVALKQYLPEIKTVEQLHNAIDIATLYKILDLAAGIKMKPDEAETAEEDIPSQAKENGTTWDSLDLAKLEAEVFLIGIWKDYEELELSLSMPELMATLASKRELDYEEKKFLAAIQGVDLDKQSGKQNEWEEMKARVFSKGQTSDANDILAYQGINASKAGFGIGNGLGYANVGKSGEQPFGKKKNK